MSLKLLLDLPLQQFCEDRIGQLQTTTASPQSAFVVGASHASLSVFPQSKTGIARYAAFFLSPAVTESVIREFRPSSGSGSDDFFVCRDDTTNRLSRRVLTLVHPFLTENFSVKGIVSIHNQSHCPADIVLLDLSHAPTAAIEHLLEVTNNEMIVSGPETILKIVLISDLEFQWDGDIQSSYDADSGNVTPRTHFDLPSCPVCLHRIDPFRLGLPQPENNQLCSKFCAPPNLASSYSDNIACPRQRLLRPWPRPSHCVVCLAIDRYWKMQLTSVESETYEGEGRVCCLQCGLKETLWVCMTCGFIGCGRYSNKHSVQHFDQTGHLYALELATLRIWDYTTGIFTHRSDLLDCPSSPPILFPWINVNQGTSRSSSHVRSAFHDIKSPKKTSMIGEEYEALLQSALEEQAQHFEREITSLRARLTENNMDESAIGPHEAAEIEELRSEIADFLSQIDEASHELLEWQTKEANFRSKSQTLLREQQVVTDLLTQIKEETAKEHADGRMQVEELEQQIADLTANQKMRHTFATEELQQAQIWGMSETENPRNKARGKKGRRKYGK